ncbi:hypothetical protein A2866_00730 [Candidatus Roizmanbacteria bacterium RIFCSPHIGHO2_01_FULL_39_8]|uniref:BioF2-like acetyltransferase domain-containing protein n=2 Tax=Candidatus Roizmaniibacteriota TaxID=1752723 RepID=A0A1F7GHS0_9BACT|nr:MAG: hypothetical protein A2866_00730 [Candidatus Roizmanbacteria bacterium RIFCSPHIGHO2_01_FULL_39_8]OGK27639.1 MAG: hypothetical protein A3C28_04825 [Candidatus Roizmanbacteria bacterium RIFCSPHIGHO2_02_FULL_39_9]
MMNIKILIDHFDIEGFNKKAIHPLQSWQWGEARKKMEIEVLRIDAEKDVFQLTFHKIPKTNYKIGYLPRSSFPSKEVLAFLHDYGKKNNVIYIKIEPYVFANNYKLQTINYKLKESPHPLFPKWTQILDLRKSEEELLKHMRNKTRYNIRLAQKKGVFIKEMSNAEGFDIFSKLYFETCKRQKYFGHTVTYHKLVWENLKKNIAHILIAFYKNTPLAAYELFFFKKTLYYPYGGTSLEYRNLMASNLLMWEAILLGKKLGAETFDMWGSLPPNYNQNNSWTGFTRFKEGYGTTFTEFIGSYDLVINTFLYYLSNAAYSLRNFYLHLKKA